MDRLKYFKSEFNTQGCRGDCMMLQRWAVREHLISGAYLRIYSSDSNFPPLGGLVVRFGIYEL